MVRIDLDGLAPAGECGCGLRSPAVDLSVCAAGDLPFRARLSMLRMTELVMRAPGVPPLLELWREVQRASCARAGAVLDGPGILEVLHAIEAVGLRYEPEALQGGFRAAAGGLGRPRVRWESGYVLAQGRIAVACPCGGEIALDLETSDPPPPCCPACRCGVRYELTVWDEQDLLTDRWLGLGDRIREALGPALPGDDARRLARVTELAARLGLATVYFALQRRLVDACQALHAAPGRPSGALARELSGLGRSLSEGMMPIALRQLGRLGPRRVPACR